jgi:glutamate synthase domain-containing protein 3
VGTAELDGEDRSVLEELVSQYAAYFKLDAREIMGHRFLKIYPVSNRPYGRLYAY